MVDIILGLSLYCYKSWSHLVLILVLVGSDLGYLLFVLVWVWFWLVWSWYWILNQLNPSCSCFGLNNRIILVVVGMVRFTNLILVS